MQATKLFYCYAHEDKSLQDQLVRQLASLERSGIIAGWSNRDISAGQPWQNEIDKRLNAADIILLLISPDFIASNYCYSIEVKRAMERHEAGEARVIPIILRPVYWQAMPFGQLQALPAEGKPIDTWRNRNEAFLDVVKGITKVIEEFFPASDVCPYRGLTAFTERDHELFFGRERALGTVLKRLKSSPRFLALLGPSGSGKSSLAQAGVMSQLRQGTWLGPGERLEAIISRPGSDPFAELTLQGLSGTSMNLIERVQAWQGQHPEKERLVLIIDQFEEVWTLCSLKMAQDFTRELVALINASVSLTLILVMRDDFYPHLGRHEALAELVDASRVRVPPTLRRTELTAIMEGPARKEKLRFAEGLVDTIIEDILAASSTEVEGELVTGNTILPLLEFALTQLWYKRQNREMTCKAYNDIGRISGGLTVWADNAFYSLDERLQPLARTIFTKLIHVGNESQNIPDSCRRGTLTSLYSQQNEPGDIHFVIAHLAKARLLVTSGDRRGNEESVEIIHDVLLREWNLLKSWIAEDRGFLAWYQEFERRVQRWVETEADPRRRDEGRLLRDTDLTEAETWLARRADRLSREALDFIHASRSHEAREQQRWKEMYEKTLARQLAAQAETLLDQQPDLLERGVLLAVEAMRRYPCVETYQTLSRGLSLLHQVTYLSDQREIGNLTAPAHMGEVNAVQFSPDRRYLITVGEKGSSRLWDTATGKALAWVSHEAGARNSTASPDGRYEARISDEKMVEIKDSKVSDQVSLLPHKKKIGGIAFSLDGHYLLTASVDGTTYLWDVTTGQRQIAVVSEAELRTTAMSPNGRYEAETHEDRFIEIRDVVSGERIGHLIHPHKVYDMIFSADGTLLATIVQFGRVLVWNITNHPLRSSLVHPAGPIHPHVNIVKCSPYGCIAATVSGEEVRIWDTMNGRQLAKIDLIGRGSLLDSSPVGQYLLAFSPDGQRLVGVCDDHCARVWDLSDLSNIHQMLILSHEEGDVNAVDVSPDGRYVATAGSNDTTGVWDLTNGTSIFLAHNGPVNSVAFSPDGRYLATASDDGDVSIWDFSTPTEIHLHCAFPHKWGLSLVGVKLVVFSPRGSYIATTVQEATHQKIHIWSVPSNHEVTSMKCGGLDTIWAVAFSPDEKILASTEGSEVKVWNVETGEQLMSLLHEGTMHDVAFSPDGNYLVVPAGPHVHIWKATSADLLGRIVHKDSVNAIAFSHDGRYLATASGDTARLWLWRPEDLIKEACRCVTRNLTLEEWQLYLNDEPYRNTCTIRMALDTNVLTWSKQKRSDAITRRATSAVGLAKRTPGSVQQIIPNVAVTVQYIDEPHPAFPGSPGYFKMSSPNKSPSFRSTISDTVQSIWDTCIEIANNSSPEEIRAFHRQLNLSDNTFEEELE